MITREEVIEAAKKIKEYCKGRTLCVSCKNNDCPFYDRDSLECKLAPLPFDGGMPSDWDIEEEC